MEFFKGCLHLFPVLSVSYDFSVLFPQNPVSLSELSCTIKPPLLAISPSKCTVQLQKLASHFIFSWPQVTAVSLHGPQPGWREESLELNFAEAPLLLNNPPSISDLVVQNIKCSWSKLSQLARHIVITGDSSIISDNADVYYNLKNIVDFEIQGLRILNWSPIDEMSDYDVEKTGKIADEELQEYDTNTNNGSSGNIYSRGPYADNAKEDAINILEDMSQNDTVLLPLPGMETIKTLVMQKGNIKENGDGSPPVIMTNLFADNTTVPTVLQTHLWPELAHLELVVNYLDLDHILLLNRTAPNLSYLKLYVPFDNIPDIVWTFDWDLLPWRTGFIAVYEPKILCTESLKLDISSKIESKKILPINF